MAIIEWEPTKENLEKSKAAAQELLKNPWADEGMKISLRAKIKRFDEELDKLK